jgi:hypothetical protein
LTVSLRDVVELLSFETVLCTKGKQEDPFGFRKFGLIEYNRGKPVPRSLLLIMLYD